MKRINPKTHQPFKRGDTREDGFVFWGYVQRIGKSGFLSEQWRTPEDYVVAVKRHRKAVKTYTLKNVDAKKDYHKTWCKENRDKRNVYAAKYRAAKDQRFPNWLTQKQILEIKKTYEKALKLSKKSGIVHHVDHIVPLRGEHVSGLHVPWNLQIITAEQNWMKNNSFELA